MREYSSYNDICTIEREAGSILEIKMTKITTALMLRDGGEKRIRILTANHEHPVTHVHDSRMRHAPHEISNVEVVTRKDALEVLLENLGEVPKETAVSTKMALPWRLNRKS